MATLVLRFVADRVGLRPAVLAAAVVVIAGVGASLVWRLPETGHIDPQHAAYWATYRVAVEPDPDRTSAGRSSFHRRGGAAAGLLTAMDQLRLFRLRTGATSWELYRDGEHPDRFVEIFRVPSWEELLRQHEGGLTGTDQVVGEAALASSDPAAYADHLLPRNNGGPIHP